MKTQFIKCKTTDSKAVLRPLALLAACLLTACALSAPAAAGVICDGTGCIELDHFSRAIQFQPTANPNHLFELMHFISVNNGPVEEVNAANYAVITPLPAFSWLTGSSSVLRNPGDLQIEFWHYVSELNPSYMKWTMYVVLINRSDLPMDVCHYLYTDPDLFGTPGDDSAQYVPVFPPTGTPAFLLEDAANPGSVFVVQERTGLSSNFELNPYPLVKASLSVAPNCIGLPNVQPNMYGDVTGAMQSTMTIPYGGAVFMEFPVARLN